MWWRLNTPVHNLLNMHVLRDVLTILTILEVLTLHHALCSMVLRQSEGSLVTHSMAQLIFDVRNLELKAWFGLAREAATG